MNENLLHTNAGKQQAIIFYNYRYQLIYLWTWSSQVRWTWGCYAHSATSQQPHPQYVGNVTYWTSYCVNSVDSVWIVDCWRSLSFGMMPRGLVQMYWHFAVISRAGKIGTVPNSAAYRKIEKPQVVVLSFLSPVDSLTIPIQWTVTPHADYFSGLNMEIANSSKQFIPPYGITPQKPTVSMVTIVSTSHLDSITSETLLLSNSIVLNILEWCFQFEKHFLAQECQPNWTWVAHMFIK